MLVLKERQNNDKRADTDENVRKVEDRKADKPEIEEVNDIGSGDPVDQISQSTGDDQRYAYVRDHPAFRFGQNVKHVAQRGDAYRGYDNDKGLFSRQKAERDPGIFDIGQMKDVRNERNSRYIRQKPDRERFRELIDD